MFWNPYALPALIGGVLLYVMGIQLGRRVTDRKACWSVGALLSLLCLPALTFDLYYAHLIATPWWYIEFRSVPGIEMLAACWGLLYGFLAVRWNDDRARLGSLLGHGAVCVLVLLALVVPFLKPVIAPVEVRQPLLEVWQGKICRQTCSSTCGPASLATIFAYYGQHHSEREIARASYASASGTELWYLLRFSRRHGLHPAGLHPHYLSEIPVPALLGVSANGDARCGHFITLLGKSGDSYLIGDPLGGQEKMNTRQFLQVYGRVCDVVAFAR